MVGIQIEREQEEGERGDDAGFEKIEDFNVTSNAEEKFCGSDNVDMTFDMELQLGGEVREEMIRQCMFQLWSKRMKRAGLGGVHDVMYGDSVI